MSRAWLCLVVGAALPLNGCSRSVDFDPTNATTTRQLDTIADNTADTAGRAQSVAPLNADSIGQSMRAASTKPPPR